MRGTTFPLAATLALLGGLATPNAGAQSQATPRGSVAPSRRYEELLTLFAAWRSFQQPALVNAKVLEFLAR